MPFENPNGLTNFVEMLAMLAIPASLTYTYGRIVGSRRQGWTIFGVMFAVFIVGVVRRLPRRVAGRPRPRPPPDSTGANLEGKELRFGTGGTALWTVITTATSTGAVNSAFESLTGIGGLVPMVNMGFGESIFGGVGTGLYTMLLYVLLAVFIGGLMVGRTPEYLGKKLEAREIKLIVLALLVTPLLVLVATAWRSAPTTAGLRSTRPGPQGFSETLYAYLSQANNNGSAFAGYTGYLQPEAGNLGANGVTFADLVGGLDDADRPLRPDRAHARHRRRAAQQARRPRRPRDHAHRHAHVRRADRRHGRDRRRPHLPPRPAPRTCGPGPDRPALLP